MHFIIRHLYELNDWEFPSFSSSGENKKEGGNSSKKQKNEQQKQDGLITRYYKVGKAFIKNELNKAGEKFEQGVEKFEKQATLLANVKEIEDSKINSRASEIIKKKYPKMPKEDVKAIRGALRSSVLKEKSWNMSDEDLEIKIEEIVRIKKLDAGRQAKNAEITSKIRVLKDSSKNNLEEDEREIKAEETHADKTEGEGANNTKKSSGSNDASNAKKGKGQETNTDEKKEYNKKVKFHNTFYDEWQNTGAKTSRGTTTRQIFMAEKINDLKGISDMNVINSMYDSWNIERLNSVTELFDINVLNAYAFDNQNETELKIDDLSFQAHLNSLGQIRNNKQLSKQVANLAIKKVEKEILDKKLEKFNRYTKYEIIGEMFCSRKLDLNRPEHLRMLQTYASSFNQGTFLFNRDHITGQWNEQTFDFLTNLVQSEEFNTLTSDPRHAEYKRVIENFIAQKEKTSPIEHTGKYKNQFESFDENSRRNEEYWKDPEAFWRKQTLEGQRVFEGIPDNINSGGDYKTGEQNFIDNHTQYLDSQIAEFLSIPRIQPGQVLTNEQRALIDERRNNNWQVVPVKELENMYEKFSKDPGEQEKFKEFLQKNNLPDIDLNDSSIRDLVIYNNFGSDKKGQICKFCYEGIWALYGGEIQGIANESLRILRNETGGSALNIKNKVLEFFLPNISIRPEKEEDGIFYFRDENNLDTLYKFNPETGEVTLQGGLSIEHDGTINFDSEENDTNLLPPETIKDYKTIINSIQIGKILPKKKCEDIDEYKTSILEAVNSIITVGNFANIGEINGKGIELTNERIVCKNEIVGDIKDLLGIEDNEISKDKDGINYTIFESLEKTFKNIDLKNPNNNDQLRTMRNFFYKIVNSISNGNPIKSNLLENSLETSDSGLIQESKEKDENKRKNYLLGKLIDPQTRTFNIAVIDRLLNDPDFDDILNKKEYIKLPIVVDKQNELYSLEMWKNASIAKIRDETGKELSDEYNDDLLAINIEDAKEGGALIS